MGNNFDRFILFKKNDNFEYNKNKLDNEKDKE